MQTEHFFDTIQGRPWQTDKLYMAIKPGTIKPCKLCATAIVQYKMPIIF